MSVRRIHLSGTSQASLQSALDQATGGGVVYVPAGRFVLETPLVIGNRTTLAGAGPGRTTFALAKGAACHMFVNAKPRCERIVLRDFTVDGQMKHQQRPVGAATVWACGGCFRGVDNVRIANVHAVRVSQTAFHFNECNDVVVDRLLAEDMGWSGVSTSGTDRIALHRVTVRRSGLDTMHSGIHLDGGTGAYVDALVEDSTGNAIMVDSAYAPMSDVVVHAVGTRSLRGVSLSGSHDHRLSGVYIRGQFNNNTQAGVMVSNAENVFLVGIESLRNGEHGILLQGRSGARHCVIADCRTQDNPIPIAQVHSSTDNWIVEGTGALSAGTHGGVRGWVSGGPRAIADRGQRVALTAARSVRHRLDPVRRRSVVDPTGSHPPAQVNMKAVRVEGGSQPDIEAASDPTGARYFTGQCRVCGAHGRFALDGPSLREQFRCQSCNAHLRYQGQAEVLVRRFGVPGTRSLAELVDQAQFRSLTIFEPGVLGPFRPYLHTVSGYSISDYWPDVPPGHERGGVRCEDLMGLTFDDESVDVVITSDIFEHVRHPMKGFAEVHRVLRPGGVHVFSIPSHTPLRRRTLARVDTSTEHDVHLMEPRYHLGPRDTRHLVYNEFGQDLVDQLDRIGLPTDLVSFESSDAEASRLITFVSTKRLS